MHIMNSTLTYAAATLAAASATWSFATGNFWPGILAIVAASIIVLATIRKDEA